MQYVNIAQVTNGIIIIMYCRLNEVCYLVIIFHIYYGVRQSLIIHFCPLSIIAFPTTARTGRNARRNHVDEQTPSKLNNLFGGGSKYGKHVTLSLIFPKTFPTCEQITYLFLHSTYRVQCVYSSSTQPITKMRRREMDFEIRNRRIRRIWRVANVAEV